MKILRIAARTVVGLTFMFSGFVKGVDPLGSAYKFHEYFEVYNMEWLNSVALVLAVFLCAIEFTIGVMLVFGVKPKLSAWLSFIMMFFFTGLTLLSAINNPVSDCGCFGDAVKLTNWETFYKNVVLIALALILIITGKHAKPAFSFRNEYSIIVIGAGVMVFTSVYSLRHLPIIDFLPWKVGTNVAELMKEKAEMFLIYKDKKTGEEFEYTSKTLPWQDSIKMASMEFVDQKKKVLQEAKITGFSILDNDNNVMTESIINNPNFQFILAAYDLPNTKRAAFVKINKFVDGCDKDSISFVALSSSEHEVVETFRHEYQTLYPFYQTDDTALKTMIRSNPGLLLLKGGVVIAKWHWRDIPEYSEVKEKYMK